MAAIGRERARSGEPRPAIGLGWRVLGQVVVVGDLEDVANAMPALVGKGFEFRRWDTQRRAEVPLDGVAPEAFVGTLAAVSGHVEYLDAFGGLSDRRHDAVAFLSTLPGDESILDGKHFDFSWIRRVAGCVSDELRRNPGGAVVGEGDVVKTHASALDPNRVPPT
jgi:hypothetical protein